MPGIELVLEAPQVSQTAQHLKGVDVTALLRQKLREWGQEGVRQLEQATPVVTGRLRRSWQTDVGPQQAEITNQAPYAAFVLTGTAAHRIEGHPFLRFLGGEGVVFARSVEHPGTRGDAELARAIEQVVGRAADTGASIAQEVAGELTHGH